MDKLTAFHMPEMMGELHLHSDEVMYYLYLPISTPGLDGYRLPDDRLEFLIPLIERIMKDIPERFKNEYVYLTVKKMFVGGGVTANRPGWHCDGFLSTDLNYVWYDSVPTIFTYGKFSITPNHTDSLREFDEQAREEDEVYFAPGELLKLDDMVIHRVNTDVPNQLMRTFIKVTVSENRFNLKDNSRNPMLPDDGPYYERALVRNDPYQAQSDSYKPTSEDDHFA